MSRPSVWIAAVWPDAPSRAVCMLGSLPAGQDEIGLTGTKREQMMAMPLDRKLNLIKQQRVFNEEKVSVQPPLRPLCKTANACGRSMLFCACRPGPSQRSRPGALDSATNRGGRGTEGLHGDHGEHDDH